ncbi:nuclear factor 7, ovary-like isoform X4 [Mustelus asterias]
MASRQQVQSLTEEAICPICLDFFTDPVILDCGHNFCRSCITQCWEKKAINSCPECREEFPERNLRINRALANLAEKARQIKLNPKEKESKLHCEEHQEELKLFCETDKKLICYTCRDSREHRDHRFLPFDEAVEIYKYQLKSSLDSLTEKKSAVLETEQKQKRKISDVREQSSSLQTHITSEFTKMHQILTEKEQRLLRDLREEEERILEPMEKNLREIQENLNSIEEKLSKLQKQMEQKDERIFLKEACRKRRISDGERALSVFDAALSIGKFKDLFQRTAWREMMIPDALGYRWWKLQTTLPWYWPQSDEETEGLSQIDSVRRINGLNSKRQQSLRKIKILTDRAHSNADHWSEHRSVSFQTILATPRRHRVLTDHGDYRAGSQGQCRKHG